MGADKERWLIDNVINPLKTLAYKIFNAKENSKGSEVVCRIDSLVNSRHQYFVKTFRYEEYTEISMPIGWHKDDGTKHVLVVIRIDKQCNEHIYIKVDDELIDANFIEVEELDDESLSVWDEINKNKHNIVPYKEQVSMTNKFIIDVCDEIDFMMPSLSNKHIGGFKEMLNEFISIRDIINRNPNEIKKPQFYEDLFKFLYRSKYKTVNITYNVEENEISIRIRDRCSLVDRHNNLWLKLKYNKSTELVEVVLFNKEPSVPISHVYAVHGNRNPKRLTIIFNDVNTGNGESETHVDTYMDMYLYESLKSQIYGLKEFISETINKSLKQTSTTTNNDPTMPEQDNNKSGMTRIENPFDKYFLKTAGITHKDPESDEYNKYAERIKGDLAMIKSSIRQIAKSVNNYFLGTEFTNIEIVDPKNLFCMTFLEDDREMIMLLNLSALNIYASYSINNIEIKVTGKGVVDAVDVKEDDPTVNIIKGNIFINDKIVSESPEAILSFSDALEVLDYIESNIESMLKIAENRQRLSRKIIKL